MPHRYQYVSKWERDRFNSPEGLELSYVYAFKMATLSSVNLWIEVSHRFTIIFRIDECVYTRWRSLFFPTNSIWTKINNAIESKVFNIYFLFIIFVYLYVDLTYLMPCVHHFLMIQILNRLKQNYFQATIGLIFLHQKSIVQSKPEKNHQHIFSWNNN